MTNKELRKYYFGAYCFEEDADGYLIGHQFCKVQRDYFKAASDFWYDRSMASCAKTIELVTTATELTFDYKLAWIGSPDTFELAVDGMITKIYYVKVIDMCGTLKFKLPEGEKRVTVYLPADATAWVKNFTINAEAEVPKKNARILWLGDSISQGFGPFRAAHTLVSVVNRQLNCDIVNQSIGAYVYDKKSLMRLEGYTPDKIVLALGTNQYGTETMVDIEEYYERLMELYGTDIPVLCITPIWRGDSPEGVPTLAKFCDKLKAIAESYDNVKVVEGFGLIPHLPEYFLDRLHPNAHGAEIYGRNLVQAIEELGF